MPPAEPSLWGGIPSVIDSLRTDGLPSEADRLDFMLHRATWTTQSEMIGELGQELQEVTEEHGQSFSTATRASIEAAFEMVLRVWPDFPR